ncbi:restriction endonuclease subunit S [Nitrosospira sp. Nsp13]|uniref:restriction endonuclease subunit S n=1 Tax=Nitrosospira sp. Nsp13 TaxID=1855332 RepID=UPI00088709D6|nr:restriction endonuclease subunit S [Nitrosospira sp. Nsp13]SCY13987.1 type I restriction enzyme, S subunit [Nitrosospira sp. Nsp13]
MNSGQLLQHFVRLSEAPDAIPRLRRFILDLAVRGKLVEQVPDDEPAAELFKRIQAEKALLFPHGTTKKELQLPSIANEDIPFKLPDGWLWLRLDEVASKITDGEHLSPNKAQNGMLLLTAKHILDRGVSLDDPQYVSYKDGLRFRERCDPRFGDLLICSRGTIGRCCVIKLNAVFCLMGSVILIRSLSELVPQYLAYFLKSDVGQLFIRGVTKGMAVNALYLKDIRLCPIAVPPLAEQHRIVAKIDELMTLCDQLEAAKDEREQSRDRLVAATLQRLNQPADDETFRSDACFTFDHLPRLTTSPAHIKQLRQTILNLAVRGRLVPQDPNEEPAAEMLKRIQAEQGRLLKEGKLRKTKTLEPLAEGDIPFNLPLLWTATRLGIAYDVRDGTHDTPKYVDIGYPLITSKNLSTGRLSFDDIKFISEQDHRQISERSLVERGDILLAMIGSIGNPVIVDTDCTFSIKNVALFKYFHRPSSHPGFLRLFLQNAAIEMRQLAAGGLQPFVSLGFLRNYPFPLPPLAEQYRIVAKVDELMDFCDHLEAQLTTTATDSRRLLEAVLHEALTLV